MSECFWTNKEGVREKLGKCTDTITMAADIDQFNQHQYYEDWLQPVAEWVIRNSKDAPSKHSKRVSERDILAVSVIICSFSEEVLIILQTQTH